MRYFKRSNGDYARLGRFTNNIYSPFFGRYYIDIQTVFGSDNTDEVPCGKSLDYCEQWLKDRGFTELEHPVVAANGFPIADSISLTEFSK